LAAGIKQKNMIILPIITTTTGYVSVITANATQILADVWPIIALAVGIPLAFYIIYRITNLIPKK
jgi:hypothetical protein